MGEVFEAKLEQQDLSTSEALQTLKQEIAAGDQSEQLDDSAQKKIEEKLKIIQDTTDSTTANLAREMIAPYTGKPVDAKSDYLGTIDLYILSVLAKVSSQEKNPSLVRDIIASIGKYDYKGALGLTKILKILSLHLQSSDLRRAFEQFGKHAADETTSDVLSFFSWYYYFFNIQKDALQRMQRLNDISLQYTDSHVRKAFFHSLKKSQSHVGGLNAHLPAAEKMGDEKIVRCVNTFTGDVAKNVFLIIWRVNVATYKIPNSLDVSRVCDVFLKYQSRKNFARAVDMICTLSDKGKLTPQNISHFEKYFQSFLMK